MDNYTWYIERESCRKILATDTKKGFRVNLVCSAWVNSMLRLFSSGINSQIGSNLLTNQEILIKRKNIYFFFDREKKIDLKRRRLKWHSWQSCVLPLLGGVDFQLSASRLVDQSGYFCYPVRGDVIVLILLCRGFVLWVDSTFTNVNSWSTRLGYYITWPTTPTNGNIRFFSPPNLNNLIG